MDNRIPSQANRDRNPLTAPCVYCGQDVMPPMNLPHAEDCPSNTGIYPVRPEDVACRCPCGAVSHDAGLVCGQCQSVLDVGDHFAHQSIEGNDTAKLIVCLTCAATDFRTAGQEEA